MADTRKIAIKVLNLIEKDNAYSNIALENTLKENNLSEIDTRFIRALVYGVTERKITLDYILSKFIKGGTNKQPLFVLNNLRLALYQIMYMDKIPSHAAVNEAVSLIKHSKYKNLAPFTNAVLRNILRNDISLPDGNDIGSLSIRYSCNEDIIRILLDSMGLDKTVSFLEDSLMPPPIYLKVNNLKTNPDELIESLKKHSIYSEKCSLIDAVVIKGGSEIISTKEFQNGLFHIEDLSCQTAVSYLNLKGNERVLDTCAAPGGKTFTMAEKMNNKGEIVACDIYSSRLSLINDGAKRLGINIIKTLTGDSTKYSNLGLFDAVLCDVPCSGLGVIRRKPEIKYKVLNEILKLVNTQKSIIDNADNYVKSGGRLLYSTCTLNNAENSAVVKYFLDNHKEYKLLKEHTFLPQTDGTDGFYCALMQKAGE